ncbi:MAG: ROK family protein [Elusimicrobiota bacterium]
MKKGTLLALDVGGTKISGALVTRRGRILARVKERVPKGAGRTALFGIMRGILKGLIAKAPRGAKPQAIGAGVPGIVDAARGRILIAPNIDLSGFPVGPRLSRAFALPAAIGNDVNVALLGEQWLGAAKGRRNVIGLFPGTGVGGGIIVNGSLLTGAHGAGAELGHLVMLPGGPRCGCGNRGCLEAFASRRAIERRIRKAVNAGEKSAIKKLNKGTLDIIRSKVLKKALKRKDRVATRAVGAAALVFGDACVSLRHIFDPELFVFGGGLIEACGKFILPIVRKRLDRDPFFKSVGRCPVVPSALGDDAVILGAAALAKEL